MDDLIKRLEAGVREVGLHDDNSTELFDIEEANDAMFDAKVKIEAQAAEIARLQDLVNGIYIYANDTLSGRADGPDDRAWQRAGIVEIRNRARMLATLPEAISARATRQALQEPR